MESAKQRVSNMASAAKEKIHVGKAKIEERAEQATARSKEEKQIATEVRKVKEAEAKAELHTDKARHAAQKLDAKAGNHFHLPGAGVVTGPGGQQTYGGAGNIPPSTTTTTTHLHQSHPPSYTKHH